MIHFASIGVLCTIYSVCIYDVRPPLFTSYYGILIYKSEKFKSNLFGIYGRFSRK